MWFLAVTHVFLLGLSPFWIHFPWYKGISLHCCPQSNFTAWILISGQFWPLLRAPSPLCAGVGWGKSSDAPWGVLGYGLGWAEAHRLSHGSCKWIFLRASPSSAWWVFLWWPANVVWEPNCAFDTSFSFFCVCASLLVFDHGGEEVQILCCCFLSSCNFFLFNSCLKCG